MGSCLPKGYCLVRWWGMQSHCLWVRAVWYVLSVGYVLMGSQLHCSDHKRPFLRFPSSSFPHNGVVRGLRRYSTSHYDRVYRVSMGCQLCMVGGGRSVQVSDLLGLSFNLSVIRMLLTRLPYRWQAGTALYILGLIGYQGALTFWTAAFPGLARDLPEIKDSAEKLARGDTEYVPGLIVPKDFD